MAKLSEIVKVNISQDPKLGFDREVKATEFYVSDNQIDLVTVANYKENGKEIKVERLNPFTVKLSAQNSTKVNPANGNTVEDGEAAEDCTIGEYDYLVHVANRTLQQYLDNPSIETAPINIFDLMRAVIAKADVRGRYNK